MAAAAEDDTRPRPSAPIFHPATALVGDETPHAALVQTAVNLVNPSSAATAAAAAETTASEPAPKKAKSSATATKGKQKKTRAASTTFDTRTLMQEMRKLGDAITHVHVLSNGQTVGAFLLQHWREREQKRSK